MPYIDPENRDRLRNTVDAIKKTTFLHPGCLNFLITQLVSQYLDEKGQSYRMYNEVIGALECAKIELYRRKIAPYEDLKISENGDVY